MPFQQIWAPQRFAIAKQPNAREIYRRVFLYINITLGVAALVIALFVQDILKVMATHAFWSAYRVVPFILLAQILHHWTGYNNLGLFLTKTTKKFAWGSAVAIPSVLGLNLLLIPRYGVWGAVTATLLAYVLRFIVIHTLAQREYHIDYDWSRVFKLYAILIAAFVVRLPFGTLQIVASVSVGIALVAAATASVYVFILNAEERKGVIALLHRQWPRSLWRPSPAVSDNVTPVSRENPVEVVAEL
jgi:O-antigen/teichoic acid export membrane protein